MGCDEYNTCPRCRKFEGLKLWLGDTGFSEDLEIYTVEITSGVCSNCGYTIKLDKIEIKVDIKTVRE